MNMDFAIPLITGLFVGGIVTEVRWVLRLRQLQDQMSLNSSLELKRATSLAQARIKEAPEGSSSLGLQSLRDHLAAEGGETPGIKPETVGTRGA